MSYPRDLDEYAEAELTAELAQRARRRADGLCDYCGRPVTSSPCRMTERHKLADPTPLPAPALGMRVWFTTRVETSSYTDSFDVRSGPPKEWGDALKGVEFTHIVDFRTGEVLWRRQ